MFYFVQAPACHSNLLPLQLTIPSLQKPLRDFHDGYTNICSANSHANMYSIKKLWFLFNIFPHTGILGNRKRGPHNPSNYIQSL